MRVDDWTMMEEILWTSLPSSLLSALRKVYRAKSALRDTKTKAKRRNVFDAFFSFFPFFSFFVL